MCQIPLWGMWCHGQESHHVYLGMFLPHNRFGNDSVQSLHCQALLGVGFMVNWNPSPSLYADDIELPTVSLFFCMWVPADGVAYPRLVGIVVETHRSRLQGIG
jgi:hypothetical protein